MSRCWDPSEVPWRACEQREQRCEERLRRIVEQSGQTLEAYSERLKAADARAHRLERVRAESRRRWPDATHRDHVDRQMLVLAEETGEAAQAWRRTTGRARSGGSADSFVEELADVVITAHVTAGYLNQDLYEAIDAKLRAIEARGGL